jgi:hypothetical protein
MHVFSYELSREREPARLTASCPQFLAMINLQLKKYMHACMEIHKLCIFYENVNNCQEILQYKFSKT